MFQTHQETAGDRQGRLCPRQWRTALIREYDDDWDNDYYNGTTVLILILSAMTLNRKRMLLKGRWDKLDHQWAKYIHQRYWYRNNGDAMTTE